MDEDSDDTIDEMEMNSFIPRMEMLPEVPNRYSQEDALEKLLLFVKITRNKKIEAKNDKMMWEHCRYLAAIRYLQLLAAGEGKIKASVNAASKYYDNQGADSYKSRSIRDWSDSFLQSGEFVTYRYVANELFYILKINQARKAR